jgi:hypothetical protein
VDANDAQGDDMRLADLAFANTPAGTEGPSLRGTRRLLRDLVCVGLMMEERPSAGERLEASLGRDLTAVARAAVIGPDPAHGLGLRAHRAA